MWEEEWVGEALAVRAEGGVRFINLFVHAVL